MPVVRFGGLQTCFDFLSRVAMWHCLAVPVLSMALSACTVIRIEGGATVETKFLAGVASVQVTPSADALSLVSTRGMGLVLGRQSGTLGWMQEWVAVVPQSAHCQLVLIESNAEQAAAVVALLKRSGQGIEGVCSINLEKEYEK